MSESERAALIRQGYEAYNRSDFETVTAMLHPDVEWNPPPTSPDAGPLRGREAARSFVEPNFFDQQLSEPLEITEAGDRVLVKARVSARGAGSGLSVEAVNHHLWTVVDGLATRLQVLPDREEALAALRASAP